MAENDGGRPRALEETLRRLSLVVDGARLCAVVNEDGLALAAYPGDGQSRSQDPALNGANLAAISARMAGMGQFSLQRLAQGRLGRVLVEGEAGTLLCCPAGDVTLALLVDKEASLGHALFAAGKATDQIIAILAEN